MMDIVIRNEMHNTQVRLRVSALPHTVSTAQSRKLRNELCGREGCDCGIVAGPQEYAITPMEDGGRETWRIEWWGEGEGPCPDGERALREAGKRECMNFTTPEMAELLGLSDEQMRSLRIDPSATYINRYGRVSALYTRLQFLELYNAPAVADARKRRRGPVDWATRLGAQYGVREAALPDAAECLYRLNHYAKLTGNPATRQRIYRLKDLFVRYLYEGGWCTGVVLHSAQLRARSCWRCSGEGCPRCGYTGKWRPAQRRDYICFHFSVRGRAFSWHQPADQVKWLPEGVIVTPDDGHDWEPGQERPTQCRRPSARDYALLRWVMEEPDGGGTERPPQVALGDAAM